MEAQTRYQQGLGKYRENKYDAALEDLSAAVSSGQLKAADAVNARKHMAFIHCASGRELQCREQFQIVLKADPDFDLAANERAHPLWGPVWRSTKGAADEQRALTQASSSQAMPAQQKLAEGIREYEAGRYKAALDALHTALKGGLPTKTDELRAHKYSAFIYCVTQRPKQCRAEFKNIFTKEPSFELLPSEAGHPAWAAIYNGEKAAAAKKHQAATKTADAKKADETKNAAAVKVPTK